MRRNLTHDKYATLAWIHSTQLSYRHIPTLSESFDEERFAHGNVTSSRTNSLQRLLSENLQSQPFTAIQRLCSPVQVRCVVLGTSKSFLFGKTAEQWLRGRLRPLQEIWLDLFFHWPSTKPICLLRSSPTGSMKKVRYLFNFGKASSGKSYYIR